MSLCSVMLAAGTDKAEHGYAGAYEDWLYRYAGHWHIVLLEIGAGSGAGLRAWKEWMPAALVYGIDRESAALEGFVADGVFIGDATDTVFLADVIERIGAPSVVIDDGGHRASEQIASFSALFPRLASGGVYIIEDTHTWYSDAYRDADARGFFLGLVDAVNVAGRGMTGSFERALTWHTDSPVPEWATAVGSVEFRQSLVAIRPREEA